MSFDATGVHGRDHEGVRPSQLFLLRVWLDLEVSENDWHGRVQHAVTGEGHNFRGWAELRSLVLQMMTRKSDPFVERPLP